MRMLKAHLTWNIYDFLHENTMKSALQFEVHVYVHGTIKVESSFDQHIVQYF